MWRHIASNALTLGVVALAVMSGIVVWGRAQYSEPGPLAEAICLRVESGSNMGAVSRELEGRGAVSSAPIFRIGADYTDKSQELKAGSFLVPAGASMSEIVDIVTRGGQSTCGTEVVFRIGVTSESVQVRELDVASNRFAVSAEFEPDSEEAPEAYRAARELDDTRYRVAAAEGVTVAQVVQALEEVDFLQGEVTELPPEGSLAPESYEVEVGADRQELVERMRSLQADRLEAAWRERAADLPIGSPEEALVLASIVEKETGVPEEREQVASVFVNRLREGMRLQTDPTVIYGITGGEGALGRGLRRSELDAATPYNTYVIDGLPPTPIANPGLASIQAALNPADTNYRYFVADGSGGHAFAETLEEHNANVARWREIEAEQAGQ
ncbi:endolytic transglycosylase MltG [Roseitranquillus sediminis]|uniref:endolytic transglycosylase MltG n=1 Tax=Roseitranquillus sediminis TaxID=2809051 RepID=UPI001D0C9C64|nr:endolytic transglycosylase MltG [Roseitranquillus sediminis]MBM9595217.1 endolytic transglycosylase MltG [Roseitranquillus sediminis]